MTDTEKDRPVDQPDGLQNSKTTSYSVPAQPFKEPFKASSQRYWEKNWKPFPVKGKKEAIPGGITGREGKDPTWAQIQEWIGRRPFSNVALRANGWLSIDVDEGGHEAFLAAQAELGKLPPTWTSTSWGPDSTRRQHFYKVPLGFDAARSEGRFKKRFGDAVDLVHRGHRYSVVYPSTHPGNGQTYLWYRPDGSPGGTTCPERTELPELPQPWLDFLAAQQDSPAPAHPDQPWDEAGHEEAGHRMTRGQVEAAWDRAVAKFSADYREGNRNNAIRDLAFQAWHYSSAYGVEDVRAVVRDLGRERYGYRDLDTEDSATIERAWFDGRDNGEWLAEIVEAGAEPDPNERYTDAFMSERLAREILDGGYLYADALGWLRWDGARWAEVADTVVHEAARQWTKAGYLRAVDTYRRAAAEGAVDWAIGEDPDIKGWAALQGHGRIASVVRLARGIEPVYVKDAAEFDQDPFILNTRNGVVDLRTGELMAHDPARRITKVAGAAYVPGAASPALRQALGAIPEDAQDWVQLMLGEAATGQSGERLVLLTGGGRNGKTVLMGAVFRALGSYAAKVPNTLLLKVQRAGQATPERMTLRGVRLAYMEETPEDGYLDANVVKDLIDAEMIDGRKLYKDTVTWTPTHTIFLNTNHPPSMSDTGDGAWRRMARVDFPYRYRKPHEALERPTDRRGDPAIKDALAHGQEGQEALLAWLVKGAIRLYAAGSVEQAGPDPASVQESGRKWRTDSDDVLRFVDEWLELDPESWVAKTDLYVAFSRWIKGQGQVAPSDKTLTKRLAGHSVLGGQVVEVQRTTASSPPSRPFDRLPDGLLEQLPARTRGWAGLRFKDETSPEQDF